MMKSLFKTFVIILGIYIIGCSNNNDDGSENNLPPTTPLLLTPVNGAGPCFDLAGLISLTQATFSWEASEDPEDDHIRYRLFLGTEEGQIMLLAADIDDTSFTLPEGTLISGRQYYWKIEAVDSKGNITPSVVYSFFALAGPCP
ncbi:hypothetical protein ACOKFD_00615 [Flagellimonas sp. S174]|uniref:hypothetical protein n=1 Tax=Flagellimonas sp. S174 TaxID=3410790 RepID=UPI003BF4860A